MLQLETIALVENQSQNDYFQQMVKQLIDQSGGGMIHQKDNPYYKEIRRNK